MDLLHPVGLYPLKNKPTRITISSETLIDNFFTNKLESKLTNGLLINNISDHFLVFTICLYKEKLTRCKRPQYILKRQLNDESINAFKTELGNNSWDTVLNSSNVNVAHNNFIDIFTQLYNKHCPVKKITFKCVRKNKTWFTKALQCSCKKKKMLYKKCLAKRTESAEMTYKNYKNSLTSLMRILEKNYYRKLLDAQKGNSKATWKILNSIIKKNTLNSSIPDTFIKNNEKITARKHIANGFNDFFVNVGPNLAKGIQTTSTNIKMQDYLGPANEHSMYLFEVEDLK